MIDVGRTVTFECKHKAWRLARAGRSLRGEKLRCDQCPGGPDVVVAAESRPRRATPC